MPEMNHDILVENIRTLLKNNGMTQQQLAEVAGMTQANVSKALNPNDKRGFTLEQVFAISQHFGVSIDELVGNKAPNEVETSPRAALTFLVRFLCDAKIRVANITEEELIYQQFLNEHCGMDCRRVNKEIEYPAFYFPDYYLVSDFASSDQEYEEVDSEFCWGGNETKFLKMNEILRNLIPMIKLSRDKQIPEEAFQMIVNGYLEQLPNK